VIKIEVDEKVYQYLKQNSTFEDSPNSVLHRLLHLVEGNIAIPEKRTADIFPNFPLNTPKSLAEIIQVICLVKKEGFTRQRATREVADIRSVAIPTVTDKLCRQLGKTSNEIDELLLSENMETFKLLLVKRFPYHVDLIEKTFLELKILDKGEKE